MDNNLRCYTQIYPYLSDLAIEMVENLHARGIKDRDFAITIVELFMSDEEMYDISEHQNRAEEQSWDEEEEWDDE